MIIRSINLVLLLIICCLQSIYGQHFIKQFRDNHFWLAETQVPKYDANRVKRSAHLCEELDVQLPQHKNLSLCLFRKSLLTYDFVDEKTQFLEDFQNDDGYLSTPLHEMDFVRIGGYVIGQKHTSKVDGYLLNDKLLGRIFTIDEVFYIEELVVYLPGVQESSQSIVFKVPNKTDIANPYEYRRRRRRSSGPDPKFFEGKEVHIALHLDPAWYILPNRYCRKRAIFSVVHIIHVMNSVYRSMDFFGNGRPSNIGFYMAKILLAKNNYQLVYAPYMTSRITATAVLDRFLEWKSVKTDHSVDMHMLYTGQEVQGGVNGFSPVGVAKRQVGGLCTKSRNGMFMNSLYMDYYSNLGEDQNLLDAATSHEMGHSFGAKHDPADDAPDDDPQAHCRLFIMSPKNDKSADFEKGFKFSPCSLAKILPVLADPMREKCFHKGPPDVMPFCGNRIVDAGEECDCGTKYYCNATKNCCNTYDSITGPPCTYRIDKSSCKPPDGLCCTGNCQYRNLTYLDLSCGPHCSNGCPCSSKQMALSGKSCACGISGECVEDECHSEECTRLGLRECLCQTTSNSGCRTCCEIPADDGEGDCVVAAVATRVMLNKGRVKWEELEKHAVKSKEIKTAVYKKLCSSDNKDTCIWLMFRQFPHGEYCLWRGHVGKCTVHSICLVENEILHRQLKAPKYSKKKS